MKELIIIGAGGHARSLIDIVLSTKKWRIAGIVGTENELKQSIMGFEIKWTDEDLIRLKKDVNYALYAVGELGLNKNRIAKIKELKNIGYKIPTIISPNAYVSKFSKILEGTTVGHFSFINANSNIGKYCIINSQSVIEHDVNLGDYCHISTSVTINGGVDIGYGSFIGSKVMIREGLILPKGTIVSAGKRIMGWPQK